jgi:tetratricopeptide (TPR) repeat protein
VHWRPCGIRSRVSQVAADLLVEEGNVLFRAERFAEAIPRFERASQLFPQHALAWRGLGHALLCLGRAHDAARAFDKAIGVRPDSATALWGGAVAHAEIGNKVVAQNYLHRALALQPTWIEMARNVPSLASFLRVSNFVADLVREALGSYSGRTYRHATDEQRAIEVGRVVNQPRFGTWTFVTIGLSNRVWPEAHRPRVELVMATLIDMELCGQMLANLAFHLGDTGFFPEPGTMVRDVIGALAAGDLSRRLPHVYISRPREWSIPTPLHAGPPPTTLVQVVPISEAEYGRWRLDQQSFAAAITRIDVADLRRIG